MKLSKTEKMLAEWLEFLDDEDGKLPFPEWAGETGWVEHDDGSLEDWGIYLLRLAHDEVAQLEAEVERLQECVLEAYRIHNEAHLQADHYAYDLMRTVMRPLKDEVGCYPLIENALLEGK